MLSSRSEIHMDRQQHISATNTKESHEKIFPATNRVFSRRWRKLEQKFSFFPWKRVFFFWRKMRRSLGMSFFLSLSEKESFFWKIWIFSLLHRKKRVFFKNKWIFHLKSKLRGVFFKKWHFYTEIICVLIQNLYVLCLLNLKKSLKKTKGHKKTQKTNFFFIFFLNEFKQNS